MESCYFCGRAEIIVARLQRPIVYDRSILQFYYCKECYGYSLFPKLSDIQIAKLYSVSYIENFMAEKPSLEQITWNKFLRLDKFLASYDSAPGSIFFDYGCGADPATFPIARRYGLEPLGMEYSEDIRAVVNAKTGVKMYSREDFLKSNQKFDKIFLGDVIEHLVNPEVELKLLKTKLNPRGILIAQGPLQGARTLTHLIVRMYALFSKSRTSHYPPYHVSLAHRKSMQKIFELAGFEKTKIECVEVDWPAPSVKEFTRAPSMRGLILLIAKSVDKFISMIVKSYGSRFFLVTEISSTEKLNDK